EPARRNGGSRGGAVSGRRRDGGLADLLPCVRLPALCVCGSRGRLLGAVSRAWARGGGGRRDRRDRDTLHPRRKGRRHGYRPHDELGNRSRTLIPAASRVRVALASTGSGSTIAIGWWTSPA